MLRTMTLGSLAALAVATLVAASSSANPTSDRVLLRFRPQVLQQHWQTNPDLRHVHPSIEALNPEEVRLIPGIDVLIVTLTGQPGVSEALARLAKDPAIEFAEPDGRVRTCWTPNDPNLPIQWGLTNIHAFTAWDVWKGRHDFIIAVLDTGIDYNHPDLAAKYVGGTDFAYDDPDPWDGHGHGTHVAGIASAITDNGLGMAGVCPNAGLMAVKVLDDWGSGWWSDAASGIVWATDNGCHVINMSFGGSGYSTAMELACQYAWDHGVLLAAAAGNSYGTSIFYPAYYAPVIATAASDRNDQKADFSTYGSWVEVSAPGLDIWSCLPIWRGSFGFMSGTSMASPHVAGAAALLYSRLAGGPGDRTAANATQVRAAIERTADPVWFVRHGRINLNSALNNTNLAVTVTANSASGMIGTTTTLSATLARASDGAPAIGRTLRFFVGETEVGSDATDSSGYAQVPYFIPESLGVGDHTYEARFAGDGSYLPAEGAATLRALKAPTSVSVPPVSAQIGATVTLTASLSRSTDGVRLPNRSISFTVMGINAGTGVTNASGIATVQFYVPDTLMPGTNVITAVFAGDDNHNQSSTGGLLNVLKANTTVTVANASAAPGEPVRLMALLRRSTDGALINSRWLTFSVGGVQISQARTNPYGFALYYWLIPSDYPTGAKTILASFAGDPWHNGSSGSGGLVVVPPEDSVRLDLWTIGAAATDAVSSSGVQLRSTLAETPVATLESQLGGRPGDLLTGTDDNFYAGFWSAGRCGPVLIRGHVWLASYNASPEMIPLTVQLKQIGQVVATLNAQINAAGDYAILTWLIGTYDLVAKPSHWLSVKHPQVALCGDTVQDWVFLYNGDANGDNCVDMNDLAYVLLRWTSSDPQADMDGDGKVGLQDINYVLINWGKCGD